MLTTWKCKIWIKFVLSGSSNSTITVTTSSFSSIKDSIKNLTFVWVVPIWSCSLWILVQSFEAKSSKQSYFFSCRCSNAFSFISISLSSFIWTSTYRFTLWKGSLLKINQLQTCPKVSVTKIAPVGLFLVLYCFETNVPLYSEDWNLPSRSNSWKIDVQKEETGCKKMLYRSLRQAPITTVVPGTAVDFHQFWPSKYVFRVIR